MQRAAFGLATACAEFLGAVYGARVLVLAGSGDNGGDALYAGARLSRRGAAGRGCAPRRDRPRRRARGAAARRRSRRRPARRATYDLALDGIVGIGGRPGLSDRAADVVAALGLPGHRGRRAERHRCRLRRGRRPARQRRADRDVRDPQGRAAGRSRRDRGGSPRAGRHRARPVLAAAGARGLAGRGRAAAAAGAGRVVAQVLAGGARRRGRLRGVRRGRVAGDLGGRSRRLRGDDPLRGRERRADPRPAPRGGDR